MPHKKRVSVLTNIVYPLKRQIIPNHPPWCDYEFTVNDYQSPHDYLVVIHNLSQPLHLQCERDKTIFIAYDPPEVIPYDLYPSQFLNQFQWVLSIDENCPHAGRIDSHFGLPWHIGHIPVWWKDVTGDDSPTAPMLTFEELKECHRHPKSKELSMIARGNFLQDGNHQLRYDFALALQEHFGERFNLFGVGIHPIKDKLEAFAPYRFAVVVDNSQHKNYFSEKIMESFLCGTFPFYFGCPNIGDFFPKNSFREINIHNVEEAIQIIEEGIANNIDKTYQKDLEEARNLTLFKYNTFQLIVDIIEKIDHLQAKTSWEPKPLQNNTLLPWNDVVHENFVHLFLAYLNRWESFLEHSPTPIRFLANFLRKIQHVLKLVLLRVSRSIPHKPGGKE